MQLWKHKQLKHETNTIKKSNRKFLETGLKKKKDNAESQFVLPGK